MRSIIVLFILKSTLIIVSFALETKQECVTSEGMQGTCELAGNCRTLGNENQSRCQNYGYPIKYCCPRISAIKCKDYEKGVVRETYSGSLSLNPEVFVTVEPQCLLQNGMIVGGVQTLPDEFPHSVAIGRKKGARKFFFCGGSLISDRYVLSAAHCYKTVELVVRLGYHDIRYANNDHGKDVGVEKFIKHPAFNQSLMINDIALLKLNENLVLSNRYRPACLWQTHTDHLREFIAIGYGNVEFAGEKSNVLLKTEIRNADDQNCFSVYNKRGNTQLLDSQICAGGYGNDTCQGDSGGPLQVQSTKNTCMNYIVGITSYGLPCGYEIPAIYTKVSSYLDWIESIVW